MHYEEITDPIEMISYFHNGEIEPVRFRWQDKVYRVQKIHGHWTSEQGAFRNHHFSLSAGGADIFEITYALETQAWEMTRICIV